MSAEIPIEEKQRNIPVEQFEEIKQIREIVQGIHIANIAIFSLIMRYMKSKGIDCKDLKDVLYEYTVEEPIFDK